MELNSSHKSLNIILAVAILLLQMKLCQTQSGFISMPTNVAVVTGTDITLPCQITGSTQYWNQYDWPNNHQNLISQNNIVYISSNFNITGQYNLFIHNAVSHNNGSYACQNFDTGYYYSAALIVIETPLTCVSFQRAFVEGSSFSLPLCNVTSTGYWIPVVELLDVSGLSPPGVSNTSSGINTTFQEFSVLVTLLDDLFLDYTCRLYFTTPPSGSVPPNIDHTYHNQEAPQYTSTCGGRVAITTIYGPRNITFRVNNEIVANDDDATLIIGQGYDVRCESQAKPAANCSWSKENDLAMTSVWNTCDMRLVISDNATENNTYTCTARNYVNGTLMTSNRTITFFGVEKTIPVPDATLWAETLGIVSACIVGAVLLGATVGIAAKHFGNKKAKVAPIE